MKKAVAVILIIFLSFVPVKAEEIHKESNIEKIEEALPEDTEKIFSQYGFSTSNIGEKLDAEGFFSLIATFFKEGLSGVLSGVTAVISLILLSALMTAFSKGKISATVDTVCLVSCATALTFSIYACIEAAHQTLMAVFTFVSAALPIYLGILIAGGKTATASGAGGVIITSCQVMSYICTFVLSPIMNAYLAVGMCSAFADRQSVNTLMNTVRRASLWVYSFCVTVFLFIIGTKSVVGSVTDNLSLKTAKFVLGTAVPVAGGALSESATAVAASLNVLKGSAGIYIIIAVIVILLPLICSLICWRFALLLIKNLSDIFSCTKISALLLSCEAVISLLLGFVLLSLALLIISMGVMVKI